MKKKIKPLKEVARYPSPVFDGIFCVIKGSIQASQCSIARQKTTLVANLSISLFNHCHLTIDDQ